MKRNILITFLVIVLVVSMATLVACKPKDKEPPKAVTYTVRFEYGYDYKVDSVTVAKGGKVTMPAIPTRTGYKFLEWQQGGKPFDFDTPINSNIELRASWLKTRPVSVVIAGREKTIYVEDKNSYTLADFDEVSLPNLELVGFCKVVNKAVVPHNLADGIDGKTKLFADFKSKNMTFAPIDGSDEMAVSGIGEVVGDIIIPTFVDGKKVTTIGEFAFNKKSVKAIEFGMYVDTIKKGAFAEVTDLEELVIPASIKHIGESFIANSSVTKVTFAKNSRIENIESMAFSMADNLTTVIFPAGLKTLKYRTFFGNEKLNAVYIPNTVTRLENYIFFGCMVLQNVYRQKPQDGVNYEEGVYWKYKFEDSNMVDGLTFTPIIVKDESEIK